MKKIVMTIARISPQKKIQMFFDVARQFNSNDVEFIWIGGSDKFSIGEIKTQYDVPDNVHLLGDVPNASSYVHYADVFVLFSNFEGLPMSIIEALSMKKIIVASDVGGIPELVDESNGILINTVEDAVTALKDIFAKDKEKLEEMEDSSGKKFEDNFSLDKMWTEYKALYEKLLEK